MPHIDAATVITDLYENFFRHNKANKSTTSTTCSETLRFLYEGEAMLFSVALGATYLPTKLDQEGLSTVELYRLWDLERHEYGTIHFALTSSGYVSVWTTGLVDEPNPMLVPSDQWKNVSNHDSCWRTDGVDTPLNQAFWAVANKCQDHVPEDMQLPFNDLITHVSMNRGPAIVHVWYARTDNTFGERYKLTRFEPSLYRFGVVAD